MTAINADIGARAIWISAIGGISIADIINTVNMQIFLDNIQTIINGSRMAFETAQTFIVDMLVMSVA